MEIIGVIISRKLNINYRGFPRVDANTEGIIEGYFSQDIWLPSGPIAAISETKKTYHTSKLAGQAFSTDVGIRNEI